MRGARWLPELLELLPNLRVIPLMGNNARDGWKKSGLTPDGIDIPSAVPHPSKKGMLNSDARLRLHRGLFATMTAPDGADLRCPPEPPPIPRTRSTDKRTRTAAPKAATKAATPQTSPTLAPVVATAAPTLSDDDLWDWRPTLEHCSSPGSNP